MVRQTQDTAFEMDATCNGAWIHGDKKSYGAEERH